MHRKISILKKSQSILIGGTGRSGTTVLKKVLSNHPDIIKIPEWRGTIDPDGLLDFYCSMSSHWTPYFFDIKLKRLKEVLHSVGKRSFIETFVNTVIRKLGVKVPVFKYKLALPYNNLKFLKYCPSYLRYVDELIEDLSEFKYNGQWNGATLFSKSEMYYTHEISRNIYQEHISNFLRKVFEDVMSIQGATHYLDDNTWNFVLFDKLVDLFPNAKLIHIYRDPRDVVASFITQRWAPSKSDEAAQFYRGLMTKWFSIRNSIDLDSFYECSLERIVENPKTELEAICKFIGIDFHNDLLAIPLNRSNSGRWKNELSGKDQLIVNEILADIVSQLGYE